MLAWDYETGPQIFECTGGIFNAIYKYQDEPDYPQGANGDITKFAFKVDKSKTGAAAQNVKYDAIPIPQLLEPPEGLSMDTVKEKWDFIRKMCEPTKADYAAEKLGLELGRKPSAAQKSPTDDSDMPDWGKKPATSSKPVGGDLELETPVGSVPAPQQAQAAPKATPAAQQAAPPAKPRNWGEDRKSVV